MYWGQQKTAKYYQAFNFLFTNKSDSIVDNSNNITITSSFSSLHSLYFAGQPTKAKEPTKEEQQKMLFDQVCVLLSI